MTSASVRSVRFRAGVGRRVALAAFVLVTSWTAWEIRHPAVPTSFERAALVESALASVTLGRLPSAVGSLLALLALSELVSRTVSPRAALFAVGVYVTMPLAFVPARLRSGGELAVGVITLAVAALVIAGLDASASRRTRACFALAGAVFSAAAAALVIRAPGWSVPVTLAAGAAGAARGSDASRTFEALVPALAYGLGPWVLFAPVALLSRVRSPGAAALPLGAVLALVALAAAPVRAVLPVTLAAPFLAGAIGIELASWRRTSTTFAAVAASLGFLVVHDLGTAPERLLTPLVMLDAATTASIAAAAAHAAKLTAVLLGVTTALVTTASWMPARWLPLPARTIVFAVPLAAGLGLRLFVYPALLARASPSLALETWAERHREGELLGAVARTGEPRTLAPIGQGPKPVELASAALAGTWLAAAADPGSRRWLTMENQPSALAEANASYRAARRQNLPLLVAGDETTLLAASELQPGETSNNPLERIVLDRAPSPLHPVDAEVGDAVELLGWQLTDDDGNVVGREVDHVAAHGPGAHRARLRVVLRVDAPPPQGSCTFVHVDRTPSRFAAEHRELAYPLRWWTAGEIIVDEYAVALGSDFSAGSYPMYWGMGVLPCEDDHRREVTRGPSDGNGRINLGTLEVR